MHRRWPISPADHAAASLDGPAPSRKRHIHSVIVQEWARHFGQWQPPPARYQNRSVHIDGVVTSSWGVPLVPFRMYKVDDGTGEVTVLSQGSRTPTRGAHVRVRGKVQEVAVFGGQALGVHLREENLRIDRR